MENFINEYSYYICQRDMSITYNKFKLIPSNSAMRELMKLSLTLFDCKKILEEGKKAPRKRKKDVIEIWLNKGNKTFNIVIAKSYNETAKKNVWIITHVENLQENEMSQM